MPERAMQAFIDNDEDRPTALSGQRLNDV